MYNGGSSPTTSKPNKKRKLFEFNNGEKLECESPVKKRKLNHASQNTVEEEMNIILTVDHNSSAQVNQVAPSIQIPPPIPENVKIQFVLNNGSIIMVPVNKNVKGMVCFCCGKNFSSNIDHVNFGSLLSENNNDVSEDMKNSIRNSLCYPTNISLRKFKGRGKKGIGRMAMNCLERLNQSKKQGLKEFSQKAIEIAINDFKTTTVDLLMDNYQKKIQEIDLLKIQHSEELLKLNKRYDNRYKDLKFHNKDVIRRLSTLIIKEIQVIVKKCPTENVTLNKLAKFDPKKHLLDNYKDSLLFKILNFIKGTKTEIKEKTQSKIDLMISSILTILSKIINLNYNTKLSYGLSLLTKQIVNSDLIEDMLNHIGLGLSSTKVDVFLNDSYNKNKYLLGKINNDNNKAKIIAHDNTQKQRMGTTRTSLDAKRNIGIGDNIGYVEGDLSIPEMNELGKEIKPFTSLKRSNLKSLLDVSTDKDEYNKFLGEVLSGLKVVFQEELVLFDGNDPVDLLIKELKELGNEKTCCGKKYENKKRVCIICKRSLLTLDKKKKLKESILNDFLEKIKTNISGNDEYFDGEDFFVDSKSENDNNNEDEDEDELSDHELIIIKGLKINPGSKWGMEEFVKYVNTILKKINQKIIVVYHDGSPMGILVGMIIENSDLYGNIISKGGGFHYKKNGGAAILSLFDKLDENIIPTVGFASESQTKWVVGFKNVHKAFDVSLSIFKSLFSELIYFTSKDLNKNLSAVSVSDVFVSGKKLGFVFWTFNYLGYLVMHHNGVRRGGKRGIFRMKCADRLFDRFFCSGNHPTYIRNITFERIQELVIPKKLNEDIDKRSVLICKNGNGEEIDGRLEDKNRKLENIMTDDFSIKDFEKSTILFKPLTNIRAILMKFVQLNDRFRESPKSTHIIEILLLRVHFRSDLFKRTDIFEVYSGAKSFSVQEMDKELEKRYFRQLKNMLRSLKTGKKFSVDSKKVPELYFPIEDDEEDDDEDVDTSLVSEVNFGVSDNSEEVHEVPKELEIPDELYLRRIDEENFDSYLSDGKRDNTSIAAPIFCVCGKRLTSKYCCARCRVCDKLYRDDKCGLTGIWNNEGARIHSFKSCKKCIWKRKCSLENCGKSLDGCKMSDLCFCEKCYRFVMHVKCAKIVNEEYRCTICSS